MTTLVFKRNRGQSVLMMLASLAFVLLGAWMLLDAAPGGRERSPFMLKFWGAAAVLFFGSTLVGWGSNAFRRSPALLLGTEGLRLNAGIAGRKIIACEDIRDFRVVSSKGPTMLVVRLRNPKEYARRGGPLRRLLDHMNLKLCGSPVAVADLVFKDQVKDVAEQCNRWLKHRREEMSAKSCS